MLVTGRDVFCAITRMVHDLKDRNVDGPFEIEMTRHSAKLLVKEVAQHDLSDDCAEFEFMGSKVRVV